MQEVGDRQGMAHNLFLLGQLARDSGDNDQARARWQECQALEQALGVKDRPVLLVLGRLAFDTGDYAEACQYFETYLMASYEIGGRWGICWGLQGLGELALVQGEPKRAARLLAASRTVRESIDHPFARANSAF